MGRLGDKSIMERGRSTSNVPPGAEGSDSLCRVCRVVEYQFHHYGAYACNRCRAFFRRMVRRQRKGNPPTPCITTKGFPPSDKPVCDISLFRGACQACRYLACLNKGMDPSLVLTDEVRSSRYSRTSKSKASPPSSSSPGNSIRKAPCSKLKSKHLPIQQQPQVAPQPLPSPEKSSNLQPAHPRKNSRFYLNSPVVNPPWASDLQEECGVLIDEEGERVVEEAPPSVSTPNVLLEESDFPSDNDPLVLDDVDPIIGGGGGVASDRVREIDSVDLEERAEDVFISNIDTFSLDELYRFVNDHHGDENGTADEDDEDSEPRRFDDDAMIFDERERNLQTPSFEGLMDPAVFNISFLEVSSLVDIL